MEGIPDPRPVDSKPQIIGAPTAKQWYHGQITNDEAEERLKESGKEDGNYLVYDFYNEAGPVYGEYKLLVYYDEGKVYRRKISRRQDDGRFILGEDNTRMVETYASVRELIKAHRGIRGKPLTRLDDGRLLKLTRAYIIMPIATDSHHAIPECCYRMIHQRERDLHQ